MRETSRGSYLTRTSRSTRPTSPVSAFDQYGMVQVKAVGPQLAVGVWQERDPERHAVLRHAQGEAALVLPPDSDRWPLQHAMDLLMVAPGDLPPDHALQLAQGQGRGLGRVSLAALGKVAPGRARQEMHAAHHGADQPFDMAAVVRCAGQAPKGADAFVPAGADECPRAEVGAVVDVHGLGEPRHRPGRLDLTLLEPSRLVVDGVEQAQADRDPRGRV